MRNLEYWKKTCAAVWLAGADPSDSFPMRSEWTEIEEIEKFQSELAMTIRNNTGLVASGIEADGQAIGWVNDLARMLGANPDQEPTEAFERLLKVVPEIKGASKSRTTKMVLQMMGIAPFLKPEMEWVLSTQEGIQMVEDEIDHYNKYGWD